jgi:chemotaxis protein MotB
VRRKRRHIDDHENLERWLLTYSDLITLLLAFFVVMYSMSQIDNKRFGQMVQALNGVLKGGKQITETKVENIKTGHGVLKLGDLNMVQQAIEERFKEINRQGEIKSELTERGLVIHVMESALFKQGSAKLESGAIDVLDVVAEKIAALPNHIRIEGHTDDKPIYTKVYPSNWELSSARATEVVRYYTNQHQIPSDRISALGYGEYRPVRPNNSVENRAMNRRVDIVILTMEMTEKEPTSQMYDFSKGEQSFPTTAEKPSPTGGAAPDVR